MKTIVSTALMLAFLTTGCSGKKEESKTKDNPKKTDKDDHEHGEGPHKGTLFDWGPEGRHLEFKPDHKKQEVMVYVLKADQKTPAPIKADKLILKIKKPDFQIELTSLPEENDPKGTTSRFVGKDKRFGVEQEFEGSVTGTVDGKQYTEDFKEEEEKPAPPKK